MVSPKSSFGLQLCGALEQLEPSGEPVPVRVVLLAPRQPDQSAGSGFQALLQERSVVQFQQPIGDMHSAVRIDADQVVVERRMVDFRERYAFGYDGLAEKLIAIVMMCAEPSRRSSGKMLIAHRWVVPPPEPWSDRPREGVQPSTALGRRTETDRRSKLAINRAVG
jgi:hypothetical protein